MEASPSFSCTVRPERRTARVCAEGELDLATADELRNVLTELLEAGFADLVLDLDGLRFMDSTGLRLVLDFDREARERGISFRLKPGSNVVMRVFDAAGVSGNLRYESEPPAFGSQDGRRT